MRQQAGRIAVILVALVYLITVMVIRGQAQAGALRYGEAVTGVLTAGETQEWTFVASAGDVVAPQVERTSGDLRPQLSIIDGNGIVLVTVQATEGAGDITLTRLRLATAGTYSVRIQGVTPTAGAYRLTVALLDSSAATPTVAPTRATDEIAGVLASDVPAEGEITTSLVRQTWRIVGRADTILTLTLRQVAGDIPLSVVIQDTNRLVLANSGALQPNSQNSIANFRLPYTGDYLITVRPEGTGTRGVYTLLANFSASDVVEGISVLGFAGPVRGKLNARLPRPVFKLGGSGALALYADLGGVQRLIRLEILDGDGRQVQQFQGLNPLTIPVTLPDSGPYYVALSEETYAGAAATEVDYALSVASLTTTSANPRPLLTDDVARASLQAAPDTWLFFAEAGEVIRFIVTPTVVLGSPASSQVGVVLRAPGNIVNFDGQLATGVNQQLTLGQRGLYELTLTSPDATQQTDYTVSLHRLGQNRQILSGVLPLDQGLLAVDVPMSGILPAAVAHAYTLDLEANTVIDVLAASDATKPLQLLIERPDGTMTSPAPQSSDGATARQRFTAAAFGRYRLILTANTPDVAYSLRYGIVAGGVLTADQLIKGSVTGSYGLSTWLLEAKQGDLISVRATNLTPTAWDPEVLIADPMGHVIQRGGLAFAGLTAPVSGTYRVLVAGNAETRYAAYSLLASVQSPFAVAATSQPLVGAAVGATNAIRYQPNFPQTPLQVNIAALISPPLPNDQSPVNTIAFETTQRGEIVTGQLGQPWQLTSAANVTFALTATRAEAGRAPDLLLLDSRGIVVAEQLSNGADFNVLTFTAVQGGSYRVVASLGLNSGRYLLNLRRVDLRLTPAEVLPAVPLRYGDQAQGEIVRINARDRYVFYGYARDQISVEVRRLAGVLTPTVELLTPSGLTIAFDRNVRTAVVATLSNVELPETGLYSLIVQHGTQSEPQGQYAISLTLGEMLRLRNRGGGIIEPGQTITDALVSGSSAQVYLFTAQQGELVPFTATAAESGGPSQISLRVQDTAGKTIAEASSEVAGSSASLPAVLIPATGVYRVQVLTDETRGRFSLTRGVTQPATAFNGLNFGETVQGLLTPTRRSATWAFSGSAGDTARITLRPVGGSTSLAAFQVISAGGVALATGVPDPSGTGEVIVNVVLPFNDAYSIFILDSATDSQRTIYSLSLALAESKARSLGAKLLSERGAQGEIYADDVSDSWLFAAQAGDIIRAVVQAPDGTLQPALELSSVGGATLAVATASARGAAATLTERSTDTAANGFRIESNGVYSLKVLGAENSIGRYVLSVARETPRDQATTPIAYGEQRDGIIADDRPLARYVFRGERGDIIQAEARREPGANLALVLELRPIVDGSGVYADTVWARADAGGTEAVKLAPFTLPGAGRYELIVRRERGAAGITAGRFSLNFEGRANVSAIRGTTRYGNVAIGRLNEDNPADRITFEGKAGDVIEIVGQVTSGDLDMTLRLERTSDALLPDLSNDDATPESLNPRIVTADLAEDGTYTMVIGRRGNSTGNYEVAVNRLYSQGSPTESPLVLPRLIYGQRVVGTLDAKNSTASYTINGAVNDTVSIRIDHERDDVPPALALLDPSGQALAIGKTEGNVTQLERFRIPQSGAYVIQIVRPPQAATAYLPYALRVDLVGVEAVSTPVGQLIEVGQPVYGSLSAQAQDALWLFEISTPTQVDLAIQRLAGSSALQALIVGPESRSRGMVMLPSNEVSALTQDLALTTPGLYLVLVKSDGGPATDYRLQLSNRDRASTTLQPMALPLGTVVEGTLTRSGQVQQYQITLPAPLINVQAIATTGGLTPQLRLLDASGLVVAESPLLQLPDTQYAQLQYGGLAAETPYIVEISGANASYGTYLLRADVVTSQALRVDALPVQTDQVYPGTVQARARASWLFTAQPNAPYSISLRTRVGELGAAQFTLTSIIGIDEITLDGVVNANEAYLVTPALRAGTYLLTLTAEQSVAYDLVIANRQLSAPATSEIARTARVLPLGILQTGAIVRSATQPTLWTFEGKANLALTLEFERRSGDLRGDLTVFAITEAVDGSLSYTVVASLAATPDQDKLTLQTTLPTDGRYLIAVSRWLNQYGATSGNFAITATLK